MKYNEKRTLYESIMRDVAKTVKHHLNELSSEIYRNAANKRIEQLKGMKRDTMREKIDYAKMRKRIKDLRQYADRVQQVEDAGEEMYSRAEKLRHGLDYDLFKKGCDELIENALKLTNNARVVTYGHVNDQELIRLIRKSLRPKTLKKVIVDASVKPEMALSDDAWQAFLYEDDFTCDDFIKLYIIDYVEHLRWRKLETFFDIEMNRDDVDDDLDVVEIIEDDLY